MFFSGDRHHSEIIKVENSKFYPLYDVTLSSYTAGISKVSGEEKNSIYRVKGTLVEENNFGKISVSGPNENRIMKIECIGTKGNQLSGFTINSNELKVR